MNKYGNIDNMTVTERTEEYTTRRNAELRGDIFYSLVDERTEKYIRRRISELRTGATEQKIISEHPYIKRRLLELRRGNE
tara:strand:+ start:105 stop:344 length:240 start_codon:yes stop_codon:yes gene_type:complete